MRISSISVHVLQCLLALALLVTPAYCQTGDTMQSMKMGRDIDVAHPFFTHMGMPEGVGNYALRLAGLATKDEEETEGDFGFHLETGLSKTIGLHIRNERISNNPHTEVMFQFAAVSSADGMSGFAPFMEFEIPTHQGEKTIYTLVGFSTAWSASKFAFNQSIEYSPKEEDVEGSASAVAKVGERFFPVLEFIGEGAKGASPLYSALGGVKGRINRHIVVGAAYEVPVSTEKEFDYQLHVATDIEW